MQLESLGFGGLSRRLLLYDGRLLRLRVEHLPETHGDPGEEGPADAGPGHWSPIGAGPLARGAKKLDLRGLLAVERFEGLVGVVAAAGR